MVMQKHPKSMGIDPILLIFAIHGSLININHLVVCKE